MPLYAQPLVSVCIPTFNRSGRLRRAVESLLSCTYDNLEIIISDNASTDDTSVICSELVNANEKIRYFRHSINRGPTVNFEFARAQAKGEYFLWLSDDDHLAENYISSCVSVLEKNQEFVLVAGVAAYHNGNNVTTHYGNVIQANFESAILRVLKFIFLVKEGSMFYGLYRRNKVKNCEMPNCLAGDHVWLVEVLLEGKAKILSDVFIYREESDNTSSSQGKIAETLGIPKWHAKLHLVVTPFNLAYFGIYRSSHYKNKMAAARLITCVTAVIVFFAKLPLVILPWKIRRIKW